MSAFVFRTEGEQFAIISDIYSFIDGGRFGMGNVFGNDMQLVGFGVCFLGVV